MTQELRSVVEAARAGDREALNGLAGCAGRFVRMFSGSLSRQIRKAQGSTADFVLEGLAEALADLKEFEYQTDEQFYGWVALKIRSRVIDVYRRENRKKRAVRPVSFSDWSSEPGGPQETPSRIVSDEELRSEVGKAILGLQVSHPKEMEVVVRKIFEGESWPMIRASLGLSSDRVGRTLFAKGVNLLRPRLKEALGGAFEAAFES